MSELDYKESWVLKNWCFWNVVVEKTLESPMDTKEIDQSILKEISPEYSLEGLMLKVQYFDHLMWRVDSLEKTLMLAKNEGRKRRVQQRIRWIQIGKGVCQICIFSPCLFNSYAEYIMRNARLEEHKLESRLQGEISITLDMQMTPPL